MGRRAARTPAGTSGARAPATATPSSASPSRRAPRPSAAAMSSTTITGSGWRGEGTGEPRPIGPELLIGTLPCTYQGLMWQKLSRTAGVRQEENDRALGPLQEDGTIVVMM